MFESKWKPSEELITASLRANIPELWEHWNSILEAEPSEENYYKLTREIYSRMGIDVDEEQIDNLLRESAKLSAEAARVQFKYWEFEAKCMSRIEARLKKLEEDS